MCVCDCVYRIESSNFEKCDARVCGILYTCHNGMNGSYHYNYCMATININNIILMLCHVGVSAYQYGVNRMHYSATPSLSSPGATG